MSSLPEVAGLLWAVDQMDAALAAAAAAAGMAGSQGGGRGGDLGRPAAYEGDGALVGLEIDDIEVPWSQLERALPSLGPASLRPWPPARASRSRQESAPPSQISAG